MSDDLDPENRRVVAFLREAGFETTDSGDGVSKDPADYEPGALLLVPHDPVTGVAVVLLTGVSDGDLP